MRALLALLLVPLLAAQDVVADDAAAVERLLAAEDPASIAWGAYHAGRLGLTAQAPTLIKLVRTSSANPAVLRACVAALIDLGRPVDAGLPELVWQAERRDEAMLLAANDPDRHRAWLLWRIAEQTHPVLWMTAGNLLLQTRHPEALTAFHDGLRPNLRIELAVPDDRFGCRSSSVRRRLATILRPDGFPPVVHWWIAPAHANDAATGILLADGPVPIAAYRLVQDSREDQLRAVPSYRRRTQGIPAPIGSFGEYRVRMLAGLLRPGAAAPRHEQFATISCPSRPVVVAAFAALLDELQADGAAPPPADPAVAAVLAELRALRAKHRAEWDAFTHTLQEERILPVTVKPPRIQVHIVERHPPGDEAEPLSLLQTW